jgi:hypothetical protein
VVDIYTDNYVYWDCYVNPPEYDYGPNVEDLDVDFEYLAWFDDNQEWLEYLEKTYEETFI